MSTITVDDDTESALRKQAAACGMPLDGYLKVVADQSHRLVAAVQNPRPDLSLVEFREWLEELPIDLPGASALPADFSRADVYNDPD